MYACVCCEAAEDEAGTGATLDAAPTRGDFGDNEASDVPHCVHTHTHKHTHTHTYVCTCMYACMHARIDADTHSYTRALIHTDTQQRARTFFLTFPHAYAHTRAHTCIHSSTRICVVHPLLVSLNFDAICTGARARCHAAWHG